MNYIQEIIDNIDSKIELFPGLGELYALLVLTKGVKTTIEDVHDAWSVWQNRTDQVHKSLIPFKDLSLEIQEVDRPYMEAIHEVSREMFN